MSQDGSNYAWKHIGLHGHSVGTFACDSKGILWNSALLGHNNDPGGSQTSKKIPKEAISGIQWSVFSKYGYLRVQTKPDAKLKQEFRFDGFAVDQFDRLKECFKQNIGLDLQKYSMSAAGTQYGLSRMSGKKLTFRHCILEDADEEGEEFEPREGEELCSLDLAEVSQCVLPGNNRNEIELQFPESDAVEANNDQLVSIRFYIPPDPENDPSDRTVKTPAELLQQRIMATANIRKTTGDVIVEFDHEKGSFLTPRGRYSIELYERFFRMRGQKYDYKIKYDDISRLFLLPKPDEVHMAFVVALDKPIRQGQQRYQHLVLQTTKETEEVTVNLDEETMKKEYKGDLQPVMRGSFSNLVAKTFKVIARKKVFIPGKFVNANQQPCVKCALRANEGLLYPLEKQFVFIHKPPILIRFNEVESVEFQRYAGGTGSTRNFDLSVTLKASATMGQNQQEYVFSGIDRSDYAGLYSFLSGKTIKIKNLQEAVEVAPQPVYDENVIYGGADDAMEEESEDEDYDAKAAANDEEASGSSDLDDDEMGSEIDDDLDSDLEEAAKRAAPKKSAKRSRDGEAGSAANGGGDADDGSTSPKAKRKKKDPKAPKKARSAWQLFSGATRSEMMRENPDADFGTITKLVSAKFKELSEEERAKWDKKSAKDKERYNEDMQNYDGPDDDIRKASAKGRKDPNAPRKPKSSYVLFLADHRSKVQEENPNASFGEISKLAAKAFNDLPAEEKTKYDDMAAKDKARYNKEMASYSPPPGSAPSSSGGRKKRDPNEPKRAMTGYNFFTSEMRNEIKKENPNATFGELSKLVAQKFSSLSPSEKEKYDKMAASDKLRYKKELAAYKKKQQTQKGAAKRDEDEDSDGMDEVQDDSDDDSLEDDNDDE